MSEDFTVDISAFNPETGEYWYGRSLNSAPEWVVDMMEDGHE